MPPEFAVEPTIVTEPKAPKEMLSVSRLPDGRADFRINFSSLDLLQTCARKSHYVLNRGLVSTLESPALIFGTAIHAALEVWYCAPRASRRAASADCDDSQANMLVGQPPTAHGPCVRCGAAFRFLEVAKPLAFVPPEDKRSCANGLTILNAYFDHYESDPFVVLSDDLGPMCERRFDFVLAENEAMRITYFGTVDTVLRNEQTGHVLITDHKTTSSLGGDFLNRIRPNFQYVGYVMGAKRVLGLDANTFLVNGIQVAKTKTGFSRQVINVSESDEAELTAAVTWQLRHFAEYARRESWPMSAPTSCGQWGGCQFRAVCEVPSALRENVISALYKSNAVEAAAEGAVS